MWILLSLLTAFCVSAQEIWVKKHFSHLTVFDMTAYPLLYSLPIFLVTWGFVAVPPLDRTFWLYFIVSIPLNMLCLTLYMQAIKISPISLTVPYLAFTPVFIIVTGYLFLDEFPNQWGIMGIFIVCGGSYILNLDYRNRSIWAPFKAVFREPGSRIMVLIAFLFSIAAVIGKVAILHSSALYFTLSFFAALDISVLLVFLLFRKISLRRLLEKPYHGLLAGIFLYFHALCHGLAITMAKAAYMISVKRLSVLFSVILGGMIFKEDQIVIRAIGTLFMLSGSLIIMLVGR